MLIHRVQLNHPNTPPAAHVMQVGDAAGLHVGESQPWQPMSMAQFGNVTGHLPQESSLGADNNIFPVVNNASVLNEENNSTADSRKASIYGQSSFRSSLG